MPDNPQRDRFLALGGAKLPPRERDATPNTSKSRQGLGRGKGLERKSELARGGRPKQESVKQKILNAKWAGIREATIYWLNKLDPDGARCFECGRKAKTLDLDHIVPRSKGGHYSVSNAQLLCRECHGLKHGQPQWSKGQESA